MRIQHNISALNTHRNLSFNNSQAAKNLEKLSSGYKINRAGDDAAGLAISEKMRAQIRGLDMASKNSQDAISLIQTAEGALNETHSILQRMRELAVQSSNDTNVTDDREALQKEIEQLIEEIDRIANTTEFNTQKLLDGSFKGTFQIGANEGQSINLNINKMGAAALGLTATTTVQSDVEVTKVSGAGSGATPKALADGIYTVEGNKVLDSTGNQVGTVNDKSVKLTDGISQYEFDESISVTDGSTITVKNGKATLESKLADIEQTVIGKAASGSGAAIADGEYTVSSDGTKLLNSSGTEVTGVTISGNTITKTSGSDSTTYTFSANLNAGDKITLDSDQATAKIANGAKELPAGNYEISGSNVIKDGQVVGSFDDTKKEATIKVGDKEIKVDAGKLNLATALADGSTFTINGVDISNRESASATISKIDEAIKSVSEQRATLGAVQNRLEHTINNLGTASENLTAAESRIRDTDMAKEMMEFTKNNILMQAAQAMLAQANQQPQGVLQLLQ
ncbi:flagellin [Ureibacillus sp. FSL W7-1570]|uniref:flagellin N-terminal helical domain-containing protein n=1 Tax=Ureibacillus sp. FSL W7-1570 TaxID=2954593 RepID=UPI00315AF7B9